MTISFTLIELATKLTLKTMDAAFGYGSDKVFDHLFGILGEGKNAEQLLNAFQEADICFQNSISDDTLMQAIVSKPLSAIPTLEILASRLPKTLNDNDIRTALRHQFSDDWPRQLTQEQIDRAVRVYMMCLDRSLSQKCDQLLPTIYRKIERLEETTEETLNIISRVENQIRKYDQFGGFKEIPEVFDTCSVIKDSYEEILIKSKFQVENEARNALSGKYIPSIYINRDTQKKVEEYINKRPIDAIGLVANAINGAQLEISAIRDRIAELTELNDKRKSKGSYSNVETLIDQFTDSIEKLKDLIPLLEELKRLLKNHPPDIKAVRILIEKIHNHPGLTSRIHSQIDKVNHTLRNCLVIKDMAGRGKTNLLCALAMTKVNHQPTILIMAGTLQLGEKLDLCRYVISSLGYSNNEKFINYLSHISDVALSNNNEVLVLIDAINENRNTKLLKSALEVLVTRYNDCNFKFIVTCRDIYWDGFLYEEGDFWDDYIYDEISLGDFTKEEFSKVLPLYFQHFRVDAILSKKAQVILRNPLLLRFFCEAYRVPGKNIHLGHIHEIRLKELFDTYWMNKISSIQGRLEYRSGREIEKYLLSIARKMRFKRDRSLTFGEITRITGLDDFDTIDSMYTRILDEGIILEQTPAGLESWHQPMVTFVYDEFMEYVMARDIMSISMNNSDQKIIDRRLKRILRSATRFNSIYGVVAYLLPMLEANGFSCVWNITFSRGEKWYYALVDALHKVIPNRLSNEALLVANELAMHGNKQIRSGVTSLANLIEQYYEEDALILWRTLLNDPVSEIRLLSRDALVMRCLMNSNVVEESFIDGIYHKNPKVRATAAYALAEIGCFDIDLIEKLLVDRNGFVREAGLYLLETLWDEQTGTQLEKLVRKCLNDNNSHVRKWAEKILLERQDV